MFRAILSGADLLKNSIPIIAEIIDEGMFTADQNGISLLSPDRTMVSVVDFRILSSAFDEYSVEGKEELWLNMANLSAVVKRLKGGDKLLLESTKNRLKIKVMSNGSRVFEIPLIEVRAEKPPIEQLAFPAKIEMNSGTLEEGVADAELIGDSVIMEAAPDSFRMSAKGDTSSVEFELKKGDEGLKSLEVKEAVRAQYPLDYLKKMIKAGKLSGNISVELGTDYPMRLIFKELDKIQLSFILAPRVQE